MTSYTYTYGQDQQESSHADWVGGFIDVVRVRSHFGSSNSCKVSRLFGTALPVGSVAMKVDFEVHDGCSILFQLHGRLTRALAVHANKKFEGFVRGARYCRRMGFLSNRVANKLADVDITFNMMKHMTAIRAKELADELLKDMMAHSGSSGVVEVSSQVIAGDSHAESM